MPANIQRTASHPPEPTAYDIVVKVDYPDGHVRQLREAALWIDGEKAVTQSSAVIGKLTWLLAGYTESGVHTLQARIVDELGLMAESEVLTVTVSLETSSVPAAARLPEPRGFVLPLLGLLALASLVGGGMWLRLSRRAASPAAPPPHLAVTQPFRLLAQPAPTASPRLPLPQLHLPKRPALNRPTGQAYLEVLEAGGGGAPRENIELVNPAVKLGRDATLADITFPDHSVSRLHARLVEVSERVYHIFDEGSTSGTWVNFTQIPNEGGQALKDGDVINLGRVQVRFKQRVRPPEKSAEAEPMKAEVRPPTKPKLENGSQPPPPVELQPN